MEYFGNSTPALRNHMAREVHRIQIRDHVQGASGVRYQALRSRVHGRRGNRGCRLLDRGNEAYRGQYDLHHGIPQGKPRGRRWASLGLCAFCPSCAISFLCGGIPHR